MTSLSAVPRSGHLPAEVTTFIGRQPELADVKRLLQRSRLVTLRGAGGVGKTRLAVRVAAEVQQAFPDGVWFVELSSLREPELLARTVTEALNLPDAATGDPVDLLADHLADRNLLLVLDTCEHLVDSCALLAEVLLRAAPRLRILATSREPLDVMGEHALLVPPLETPDPRSSVTDCDSVTLFADRAEGVMPGFALSDDNRESVARLCQRLDGIPLAIELAAVRLRTMSVEQIVARLDDRFHLLGPARTSLDRHQTLRAAVEWSHGLCTEEEQLLWAQLSVFPGGFDLEAADQVCAWTSPDALIDTLGRLVEKSIVLREPDGHRYRMLDTIREYGAELLDRLGDRDPLHRRHRDHYLTLAERAVAAALTSEQVGWLVRLRRENANLRVALDYSYRSPGEEAAGLHMTVLLRHYWLTLGLFSEGRRWHSRALTVDSDPRGERGWILYGAATLALQQGDLEKAGPLLAEAAALAGDDRDLRAHITEALGISRFFEGDLAGAGAHYETALAEFAEIGYSDAFSSVCPVRMAAVCCLTGELDRAISLSEQCLAASDAGGEQWGRAFALWIRGAAHWMSGEIDRSVRDTLDCLRIKQNLGDLHGITMAIDLLTVCAVARGEFTRAAVLSGAGDAQWKSLRAPIQQGPHYVEIRRDAAETARRALGDDRFVAAHQRGMALSVDEAIVLAADVTSAPMAAAVPHPLTKREQEVADLVAQGLENHEIAQRLQLARRTVDSLVEQIMTKLGFVSRNQIALWSSNRE